MSAHTFDLPTEMRALQASDLDVASKTLLKTDDLRIVLLVLKKDAQLKEHHADARISIQVLHGAVRFTAQANHTDLKSGALVWLEPSVAHAVAALDPSALLITMAWPSAKSLAAMPHRGYS